MRVSAIRLGAWILPACLLAAGASAQSAQGAAAPPARAPQNAQLRGQISILEAVLERAVQEAVSRALAEVTRALEKMPGFIQLNVPMWTVQQRARGFHVDGYGVFFDIDVPDFPATATWGMQIATLNDGLLRGELAKLSEAITSVTDSRQRLGLDQAMARVKRAAGTNDTALPSAPASGAAATRVNQPGQAPPGRALPPFVELPSSLPTQAQIRDIETQTRDIYRAAMKDVLIDTMLDPGRMLQIAPDERLTLAARLEGSGLATSQDPTVFLTLRGRDLAALYAGHIGREEAKKLVEVVWK